jgi:hypothetical protein
MALPQSGNTEEQNTTELLNVALAESLSPSHLDELDKSIIADTETVSESVAAECRAELAEAKRADYRIPRP